MPSVTPVPNPITLDLMRQHFYTAVVCDALDAAGCRNQSPRVPLRSLTVQRLLVGRCKTTLWAPVYDSDPRPYELELQAVDAVNRDDVLICAANGSLRSGLWGELLTTAVQTRGAAGAIVDGAVRDVAKMKELDFPVWAAGTSPYDSRDRDRVVEMDVVVEIDSIPFAPGDLVFADADGIVVVPQKVEAEVLQRAWTKVHAESEVRRQIAGGVSATEAFERFGVL